MDRGFRWGDSTSLASTWRQSYVESPGRSRQTLASISVPTGEATVHERELARDIRAILEAQARWLMFIQALGRADLGAAEALRVTLNLLRADAETCAEAGQRRPYSSMPAPLIEFPADDPDRPPVLARSPRGHPRATARGGRIRGVDRYRRPAPRSPRAWTGPRRHRLPALLHRRRPGHDTRARPRARRLDHPPRRSVGRVPGLRGQPVRAGRRAPPR